LPEHNPVFTIGRGGSRSNILVDQEVLETYKICVYEIDRGGDITYHGPGQIVVYPILDLKGYKKDIRWYLRSLEAVIINFLDKCNIKGEQKNNFTGVWVGEEKIASIGIGVSKWISYHGFSLNICPDLEYFDMINPCGLVGAKVTSLSKILNKSVAIQDIKDILTGSFEEIFGVKIESRQHLAKMA
jgi:lipoate-protein ligase B